MPDTPHQLDETPAGGVEDSLDELLGDAVVYEAGQAPPASEAVASFESSLDDDSIARSFRVPEKPVSPVFWAAAIVWNLPGGIGGWWLLRRTHPRTARRLLLTGIIAFVVIGLIVVAMVVAQRRLNPSYVFIRK